MPLPRLFAGSPKVDVQETSLALDALGRYVCSTWEEATQNGGPPFTAVVVGAGMYGAYCATKLRRLDPGARVLLLDAGRFLVSEHVQNLAKIGFGVPGPIPPAHDPGVARELVWGIAVAGQCRVPGPGLLHRGQVDLLGRLVSAAHRGRPGALAGRHRAVPPRSLHRRRKRDRRGAGHRLHLRRAWRGGAERVRGRGRDDARHRDGHRRERG